MSEHHLALGEGARLYIDTSVLAYYFYPYPKDLGEKAKTLLNKIEHNTYIGILTPLTLMELIHISRDKLFKGGITDVSEINRRVRSYIEFLYKFNGLEIVCEKIEGGGNFQIKRKMLPNGFLDNSLELIKRFEGYIYRDMRLKEWRYVHLGAADIIHALMARELECDGLVTTDRAFSQLYEIVPILLLQDLFP